MKTKEWQIYQTAKQNDGAEKGRFVGKRYTSLESALAEAKRRRELRTSLEKKYIGFCVTERQP